MNDLSYEDVYEILFPLIAELWPNGVGSSSISLASAVATLVAEGHLNLPEVTE